MTCKLLNIQEFIPGPWGISTSTFKKLVRSWRNQLYMANPSFWTHWMPQWVPLNTCLCMSHTFIWFLEDLCRLVGTCYSPTSGTTHLTDLVNFSLLILSYLIISDFEPWGDSLWELTYLMPFIISQTRVRLMANLVSLNLTLFLTVHFCAVHGYAATHMCITHVLCFLSILPLPCGCIISLISVMPTLNSISRSDTNMYIQYDSI